MQLKIKRASLNAAITVINALHRGARYDPPKTLTISATQLVSSTENTASKIPLNGTGEGKLTILFKDVSNALPVLDANSDWISFNLDGDSISISDDSGGKLLIYHVDLQEETPLLGRQISSAAAYIAIGTFANAFEKANQIISPDHPEYEALYFCLDGRIVATDTAKVLFMMIPNYRLYSSVMLRVPWRLVRALNSFYNLDKTNLPVIINLFQIGESSYIEAQISKDFWLVARSSDAPAPIVEKALLFKPDFSIQLCFNRKELVSNFEQLTKFLIREENPYVTVTLSRSKIEVAATPRASGSLTKTIASQVMPIMWDGEIKFYLHPKHIASALGALDSDNILLSFSDNNAEPVMISPVNSNETQVLVAKMRYPERES